MKNVRENQKISCIEFTEDEMKEILSKLFNDEVLEVIGEDEDYNKVFDVTFDSYDPDIWYDEVIEKLEDYFDIAEITGVMVINDEFPLLWVMYNEGCEMI